MTNQNETLRTQTVQPLAPSMLQAFLQRVELDFEADEHGNLRVLFPPGEVRECELQVWFSLEGGGADVLAIRIVSSLRLNDEQVNDALQMCNAWNATRRWPTAYVYADDNLATVNLDRNLDVEAGIHQALLDDFCLTTMTAATEFWDWVYREQEL